MHLYEVLRRPLITEKNAVLLLMVESLENHYQKAFHQLREQISRGQQLS